MKPIYAVAALMLLAACEKPQPAIEPATPIAAQPAVTAAPASNALRPDGWAAIKIGMTNDEAVAALEGVKPDSQAHDQDWTACHVIRPIAPEGVWLMVEENRITRISVNSSAGGLKSDTGVAVGDTPEAVRAAYPTGLVELPHKYEAAPAMYLTYWAKPAEAGVRYTIGGDGKVAEISVGGPSIEYVEGCS